MTGGPVYIRAMGLACPLGLRWPWAFAAMRAGIDRSQMLDYRDNQGERICGSRLNLLDETCRGDQRWISLLAFALKNAVEEFGVQVLAKTPIVLALPPDSRGKALPAERLARQLSPKLGMIIDPRRLHTIAEGAPGGFRAVHVARDLLQREPACIVAAADSLVNGRSLLRLEEGRRLLTPSNPDGVVPGEAAACLVLVREGPKNLAVIRGLGFANEDALLDNDIPLRGNGIVAAARAALNEAGLAMHEMDFRLSDAAGESYSFKEQSLLVSRLLRTRKADFPLWLCAESLGDTGSAAGLCGTVYAVAAFAFDESPGDRAIAFVGDESGTRSALVLEAPRPGEVPHG